jgi:Lipocalin-like domain
MTAVGQQETHAPQHGGLNNTAVCRSPRPMSARYIGNAERQASIFELDDSPYSPQLVDYRWDVLKTKREALFKSSHREGIVKCTLISAVALALLSALSQPAAAEDVSSAIVGVWKTTSWTRKETGSGKLTKTYGERPAGIVIYTKGGHFVTFVTGQDRKAPEKPDDTDAERVEL